MSCIPSCWGAATPCLLSRHRADRHCDDNHENDDDSGNNLLLFAIHRQTDLSRESILIDALRGHLVALPQMNSTPRLAVETKGSVANVCPPDPLQLTHEDTPSDSHNDSLPLRAYGSN